MLFRSLLDDRPAMVAEVARIAKYVLGKAEGRRLKTNTSWYDQAPPSAEMGTVPEPEGTVILPFRRLERRSIRDRKSVV